MKCTDAQKLISKIDSAILDITGFTSASFLEQSYLAKFLVVFISGIYEESIETIVCEMVEKLNSAEVSSFVENSLDWTFRNPNIENIKSLLGRFNAAWSLKIEAFPKDQKEALNSISTNKNGLAHGSTVTITLTEVIDYYTKSKPIVEEIDRLLL